MSKMIVFTKFGKVEAKPLRLVDIHDVQPMADEDLDSNSAVTADNQEEPRSASDNCCDIETDAPAGEQ